ncbi:MAG: dynamin family protein [Candidatus Cohnella colombiensis]|uniref:Dynamin family protein n=1 Tax=Candidatus Cohnella colombiensis TaxID=3121368 RepID=A0AA95F2Q3_9BACL|nr:MAG: dynamin family protein [Cohnella sp.]
MRTSAVEAPMKEQHNVLDAYKVTLARMSGLTAEQGDRTQAMKFGELESKLDQGRLTVAFCGHFSAGKSTLVNALCGAQLLPSSPIPTSANVVTIMNGEPAAEMVFHHREGQASPVRQIAVDDLHHFAVDGEGVAAIQVSYPIPLLGDGMAIVDTPGVDSTDGAHRAATESALHLADVVCYVTDYNHVQSEVNFRFLRSLTRWGKPTYLIVNQIDKHREEQLKFADFQSSLEQALVSWDIDVAATIYLSLREKEHPLSQWGELQQLLQSLQALNVPLMTRSAERSALYLAEQFRETLHQRNEQRRDAILERLGEEEASTIRVKHEQLVAQLTDADNAGIASRERLRVELDRLLSNANITPSDTRDKAQKVLEAMQSSFKVGWLSNAAKTEAERERRLQELAADFNSQITAHLTGHIQELLRKEAKASIDAEGTIRAKVEEQRLEQSLEQAFDLVTADWLKMNVKTGAGAEGQATLHYASEISNGLKALYRKIALQWFDQLEAGRKSEREGYIVTLRDQLAQLEQRVEAAKELELLEQEEFDAEASLVALLPERDVESVLKLPTTAKLDVDEFSQAKLSTQVVTEGDSQKLKSDVPAVAAGKDTSASLGASQEAASLLDQAATILEQLSALHSMAESLKIKAERFKQKRFTIALFGAFSAGKSSFANALVGQSVLPVSPNPTTAAINRILAPIGDEKSGTARITMKSRDAFLADVSHSLRRLGFEQSDILGCGQDLMKLLALQDQRSADEVHPRGRPHLAFLKAALKGWTEYGSMLGQQFVVEEAEYRRYAAEELASCFVAEIDLYIDCPLTRSGAVLVDTPGADSINARHTGVAFEYIKNADAVLFVTYYNHAFTEADREFLNQLGSVKDVFELDKMFFIINASDLASSHEELLAVQQHVGTQLQKHGIRNPRLYPVSSLLGLQAKQQEDQAAIEAAGMSAFEQAFSIFADEELGGLAVAAAHKELKHIDHLLESWLQSANADAASREAKAARLQAKAKQWAERSQLLPSAAVQPLLQEVNEQQYHLRQRVKFRFNEHFNTAFHPSVLQDDGRDLKKLLVACHADLERSIGEDILQELRAAGLRLEGTMNQMLSHMISGWIEGESSALEGFSPEMEQRASLEMPLLSPFEDGVKANSKLLWSSFRSPKHFFEKEGKASLKDQLEVSLYQRLDVQLAEMKDAWRETAASTLQQSLTSASHALAEQLSTFAVSLSEALLKPGDELKLAKLKAEWANVVK